MDVVIRAELSDDVAQALRDAGYAPERLGEEALHHFAGVLYARGELGLERAAQLAGMPLWEFIPLLGDQGIPVADYDEKDVAAEFEAARCLSGGT